MKFYRKPIIALVTFFAATVATVAIPPAASADIGPQCANAVDIGITDKFGTMVKGSASWTKCDDSINRVEIILWEDSYPFPRHRINLNPAPFGSHARTVQHSCAGHGTDWWYTTVQAWNANGVRTASKISNTKQVTC